MITLYTPVKNHSADRIESRLSEMAAAYRRVVIKNSADLPVPLQSHRLPFLTEGDDVYSGERKIESFLNEYQEALNTWQKFQSDSCYIEDDGSIC